VKKLGILIAVAALVLPAIASAQPIGSDGVYDMVKSSGNTFNTVIGGAGTTNLGSGDDIGFTFNFAAPFSYYGTSYTSGSVSTNGLITLGGTSNTTFTNSALTATSPGAPSIAPYWDDLLSAAGQGIFQQNSGNITTLEWQTGYFSGGGTAQFQAVFDSATGAMTFNYGDISTGSGANATSATVGISKGDANPPGSFIQAGFNTAGTVISGDSLSITSAVPEPGTLTLCGFAAVAGFARMRRRKK
jgi:hypothetical protein